MTPRLAVAVNFAQFVALANHSKFSLEKKKNPKKKPHKKQNRKSHDSKWPSLLRQDLPEELVTCGSRVHKRVGYDCGCVAN